MKGMQPLVLDPATVGLLSGCRNVMVVDSRPKYINYDNRGQEIKPFVAPPANPDMPIMARLPAQEEHAIHNVGDKPFHAIRIEYKTLCPNPR